MKKITLFLLLFVATFSFAQQEMSITEINGTAVADWIAANPVLTEEETLTLTVTYTNIVEHVPVNVNPAIGLAIGARFLNDFSDMTAHVITPVTTSATQQTFTVDIDVPNVTQMLDKVRIQVYGSDVEFYTYAGGPSNVCCGTTFTINDVLSTNDFNKDKLSAYYNSKLDAIVVDSKISGDYSIYDLTGRMVIKGSVSSQISLSTLKTGLYILTTDEGTLKFVK